MKLSVEELKEAVRNLSEAEKWLFADWCREWNFHKNEERRPKELRK